MDFSKNPISDIQKCLKFGNFTTKISESCLEETLIKSIKLCGNDEKLFIALVMASSKIITSRSLNNINAKLIDIGKENISLSLFNLGINKAFEQIKEDDITIPIKQMKKLVVLQQRKILNLQKELNSFSMSVINEKSQKTIEEDKKSLPKIEPSIIPKTTEISNKLEQSEAVLIEKKDLNKENKKEEKSVKVPKKDKSKKKKDDDWDEYVLL